jgi:hypothetical protein
MKLVKKPNRGTRAPTLAEKIREVLGTNGQYLCLWQIYDALPDQSEATITACMRDMFVDGWVKRKKRAHPYRRQQVWFYTLNLKHRPGRAM